MSMFCLSNLALSLVATLGNAIVIFALWKASSISVTLKKLFLSLAVSDLAVELFAHLMFGVIIAVMVHRASSGNYDFYDKYFNCVLFRHIPPHLRIILNHCNNPHRQSSGSFLHLRYKEIVTSKRIVIALVSLWLTRFAASSINISLPGQNNMIVVSFECVGQVWHLCPFTKL